MGTTELLPSPICGETLVEHDDHHGSWFAHKNEVGPCFLSVVQIHDEEDAAAWNTRATPAPAGELEEMRAKVDAFLNWGVLLPPGDVGDADALGWWVDGQTYLIENAKAHFTKSEEV